MGDARAMTAATAALPRTRRAYDHRLREQVVRYGAKVVAGHVQIPRSTASTWRRRGLRPVVTTERFDQEKQHALDSSVRWEQRARALAAVVRLLVALLRASGFSLAGKRLPDGLAKAGILRAISSAEAFLPMVIGDDLRKRDLAIPSSARLFPSTFLIFLPLTAIGSKLGGEPMRVAISHRLSVPRRLLIETPDPKQPTLPVCRSQLLPRGRAEPTSVDHAPPASVSLSAACGKARMGRP
jgi:hypothetical protein